jgi:transposase
MNWIVGIDIAKDTFEVCMLDTADGVHKATFANTKSGINKLHRWLQ